ncbi:MAG: hypothetical protein ACJ72M_20365 [Propionibacteriaceae bacterium]
MTDISSTKQWISLAHIDGMSKAEKAAYLRKHGWRQVSRGKTPQWRSPNGVVASSASVACRIQVMADLQGGTGEEET